ncbi:Mov34/MPN/PAD-1 family protein [Macrococcus equi]|uniref:Mov34/MPN/PAD-1 family protein n=1 Tax=Macrococcus equi TaxID=3395462 RepID=UPI0039BEBA32
MRLKIDGRQKIIGKYLLIDLMNNKFPYLIFLKVSIITSLIKEYCTSSHYENGGILLGVINNKSKNVYIQDFHKINIEIKNRKYFIRNTEKAQKIIDEAWRASEGYVNYIGEWHTHPEMSALPSRVDCKTLIDLTREKKSKLFPFTIMIIIGENNNLTLSVSNEKEVIDCINILNCNIKMSL